MALHRWLLSAIHNSHKFSPLDLDPLVAVYTAAAWSWCELAGLVLRTHDRTDRRCVMLELTARGQDVAIGSGGPFGTEGPIIMTGGVVGSLIGQWMHVTDAERTTLLVAGAAAGMSATFATPVAAILLAVELLLFEWRPRSIVPVAIAS